MQYLVLIIATEKMCLLFLHVTLRIRKRRCFLTKHFLLYSAFREKFSNFHYKELWQLKYQDLKTTTQASSQLQPSPPYSALSIGPP